jgi:flagellar basal body-associated protein FliL
VLRPADEVLQMAERLNQQESRQGERGKPVLWVLVASLVLLAIATVGLLTWNGATSPKDYPSQSQDASRREVTGSVNGSSTPSNSNSTAVPGGNPSYPQPAQPNANGNTAK